MHPLTQLPLECLQRILQYIQRDKNEKSHRALVALLRVNRYIATIVLPFLYRDPFNGYGHNTSIIKPLLTQTLFSYDTYCKSLPPLTSDSATSNTVHPFLVMRLKQFLPLPISASSDLTQFDYLSHVRHINHARAGLQCQLDDVMVALDISKFMEKKELAFYLHEVSLFREMTWGLANATLDQLESLTGPRLRRDKAMQTMVEFVEAHTRLFPGLLKAVDS
ncbi:hypothetical protein BGZ96_005959 [Linnemannia gamsii]|uniref:F-box domain-containing protein n=1 Tax=Linnemannia gamsii TaxID=64522 RepID=A0ABQ7K364_9FUNG|nr:hypothetical protein BGZ96_005959 [Linnemannia gamsii]